MTIEEQILDLEYEQKSIGNIIDDKNMNNIPKTAYRNRYKQLEGIIEDLKAEKEKTKYNKKRLNNKIREMFLKPKGE